MKEHRIRVDFPHLGLASKNTVVDPAVVDSRKAENLFQPGHVRIPFQVLSLFSLPGFIQDGIHALRHPIPTNIYVPRQHFCSHTEGGVFAEEAARIGSIAELYDKKVAQTMTADQQAE